MLRCAYVDLDRALLGRNGSFLHDADGRFSVLGARALEACERAGAEVVVHGDRDDVGAIAELLGLELDRAPNVRLVESAGGGPALYEAVVTTLAEQRG